MNKLIPFALLCATSTMSTALEIVNTESIFELSRSTTNLMSFDTIDGITYTRTVENGPGTLIDISTKPNLEITNILNDLNQQYSEVAPGIFENYPNLPTEETALSEVERLLGDQEITNENYKLLVDSLISEYRFRGISAPFAIFPPGYSLEGYDGDNLVFYSIDDEGYYTCSSSNFDEYKTLENQPGSCSLLSYDIDLVEGYFSKSVSYRNGTLITLRDEAIYAYHNGIEYVLPTTGGVIENYEVANTSKPTIVPLENNDSNIYQLNDDGSVSTYNIVGISSEDFHTFQMNDKYIVQFSNIEDNESFSSGYCEYEIIDNEVRCLSGLFSNFPFQPNVMTNDIKEFMGYTPFAKLGTKNDILAFYVGIKGQYIDQTVTPILFNIDSGEKEYLSTLRINKIKELSNQALVAEYRNLTADLFTGLEDLFPEDFDSEMQGSQRDAVIDDYAAQLVVDKYLSSELQRSATVASFENLLNAARYDSTYISNDAIKTPLAKYSIVRDIEVSGSVTLPGDLKPAAGINITLVDNEGNITNTQSDANGVFSIVNPAGDNYEITFSYPNHVFECANADLSTGTFGEFEMLAGDLNNDGEISSADQWIFYFRAFYSSIDFDLNNDGVVNNTDRNIISTNRGAVQCDL